MVAITVIECRPSESPDAVAQSPASCHRAPSERRPKLIEQRLGFDQIRRVEALGEPAVDRGEEIVSIRDLALIPPEAGEAGAGAEFPKFRALPSCHFERFTKASFGSEIVLGN